MELLMNPITGVDLETGMLIAGIALALVVALGVISFVMKKKKNTAESADTADGTDTADTEGDDE
jgi:LPXTG-motif cell wall-anchored protein